MKKTFTQTNVETLLEENLASRISGVAPRDSDTELYIQFLQRIMGCNLTISQLEIMRSVNYDSIGRSRRKLQEQGLYWGSPEVMYRRRIKSYEMQQVAPNETASGLQCRIENN